MWGKVVAALAAAGGYVWYRKMDANRKQAAIQRCEQVSDLRRNMDEAVAAEVLVIDSNVWMNEFYDAFFELLHKRLQAANRPIVMFGPQFDELCNLKSQYAISDLKSRRARIALNRIEALQTSNLLRIHAMTLSSDRGAYADPVFLRLIEYCGKNNHEVALITDDRELRVRAREIMSRVAGKLLVVSVFECHTDPDLFREASRG